jgi:hypothetical protein
MVGSRRRKTPAAGSYLGLTPATLEKVRSVGSSGPRYFKVGRSVIYDTRDLDAWLASRRRAPLRVGGLGKRANDARRSARRPMASADAIRDSKGRRRFRSDALNELRRLLGLIDVKSGHADQEKVR